MVTTAGGVAPGIPPTDTTQEPAAASTRGFWAREFPNLLRVGGVVLGALLAATGRQGGGAIGAAIAGAVILGLAAHAGVRLVERGALDANGFHADLFRAKDLVPDLRGAGQRIRDAFSELSRRVTDLFASYGDTTPRTAQVDTIDDLEIGFSSVVTVPTSGIAAEGNGLQTFQRASFESAGMGAFTTRPGPDGQHQLHVEWLSGSKEGETYDATLVVKRGEADYEIKLRLTRPMMGPLGEDVELLLARQFVHDEITKELSTRALSAVGFDPAKTREVLFDTARQLELAATLLDPHHPERNTFESQAASIRELAATHFTRSDAVQAIEAAVLLPTAPVNKLKGEGGIDEDRVLSDVSRDPTFHIADPASGATPPTVTRESVIAALDRIRPLAGEGHPIHRLALKLEARSEDVDPQRLVSAIQRTVANRRQYVEVPAPPGAANAP